MQLSQDAFDELFNAAVKAQENAYAPYSNFKVGAAILTKNDSIIYTGCNVENRSNGVTVCAERVAVSDIIKRKKTCEIEHLLVVSTTEKETIAPCGVCRQTLVEFGNLDAMVYICDSKRGLVTTTTLKELVPFPY